MMSRILHGDRAQALLGASRGLEASRVLKFFNANLTWSITTMRLRLCCSISRVADDRLQPA